MREHRYLTAFLKRHLGGSHETSNSIVNSRVFRFLRVRKLHGVGGGLVLLLKYQDDCPQFSAGFQPRLRANGTGTNENSATVVIARLESERGTPYADNEMGYARIPLRARPHWSKAYLT
jgi:hypothetical protein